jgi:hypothetical protein
MALVRLHPGKHRDVVALPALALVHAVAARV